MLLLGLGVLFGGESGQWKALVRTIFLDFGQKVGEVQKECPSMRQIV